MDLRLVNLESLNRALKDALDNEDYEQAKVLNDALNERLDNPTPLKYYTTQFKAIDISDGELKTYGGEHIKAISFEEAEQFCKVNKPWLEVKGKLISEIPTDSDYNPIWDKRIDYD